MEEMEGTETETREPEGMYMFPEAVEADEMDEMEEKDEKDESLEKGGLTEMDLHVT